MYGHGLRHGTPQSCYNFFVSRYKYFGRIHFLCSISWIRFDSQALKQMAHDSIFTAGRISDAVPMYQSELVDLNMIFNVTPEI